MSSLLNDFTEEEILLILNAKIRYMSSLLNDFTEEEILLILNALEAQEKKWRAVAKRPLQGYGNASEFEKKKRQ